MNEGALFCEGLFSNEMGLPDPVKVRGEWPWDGVERATCPNKKHDWKRIPKVFAVRGPYKAYQCKVCGVFGTDNKEAEEYERRKVEACQ